MPSSAHRQLLGSPVRENRDGGNPMKRLSHSFIAAALAATFGLATIAPASADQAAATRNQILGAAALIAGIAIATNVSHKNAVASSVQGYTANGATVYGDGRVVEPNGQSFYPGNQNETLSCSNGSCYVAGNGYNGNGYNGYANGWRGRHG
jgi:hypothetical protein